MADALDVLIDDRPLIEIARDVMGGCADQLDATLMRLVIGLCALESWQEGMMDVDAASRQLRGQIVGQNLHIACKHHEFGPGLSHEIPDRPLLLGLGLLRHR